MQQRIAPIEITDAEAATIAEHVARLQATEPDLTAETLLARMTHKVIRGWNDQAEEGRRQALVESVTTAMRVATPDQVRRALAVLRESGQPDVGPTTRPG